MVAPAQGLAVELDNIWKRFPGVIANAGAWLHVKPGSVHAVLGENGAGKTTLMNVLAGVYRPDEGSLRLHGDEQSFSAPADAIAAGVGMVHQEFRLVPTFSVTENVVLGAAPRVLARAALEDQVAASRNARVLVERRAIEPVRVDEDAAEVEDVSRPGGAVSGLPAPAGDDIRR